MKKALHLLQCENDKVAACKLSEDEWSLLTQIHSFLKYFENVSRILGEEKYTTLPLAIIAFNMLLDRIERMMFVLNDKIDRTNVDEILIKSFQAARDKIVQHFQKTNWVYCAVLVLDPRHKVETFDSTSWGRELKEASITFFEEMYKNNYSNNSQNDDEGNDTNKTENNSDSNFEFSNIDLNCLNICL